MPQNLPRVVMAALRGGSGKTTLTLGLIQALCDRGIRVAPFKKGPDYIDPFWHTEAAKAQCRNLDPYLMKEEELKASFGFHSKGYEACVIEGNRGLFDGKDSMGSFSTAELAKTLKAPVILAIDCTMTSRTVAALVMGCRDFDRKMNLAGVILNPVGTKRQQKVVINAIEQATGIPVLGAVPRLDFHMPERHMGLVPPQEHNQVAKSLHDTARHVAGYVDVNAIWALMQKAPTWPDSRPPKGLVPESDYSIGSGRKPVIGVVKDAAFGFYYADNLEALEKHGAELVFCSALHDKRLPKVDALYIGGGFPETHAEELAKNKAFCQAIKDYARKGTPIYAECGGLMYLGQNIVVDGKSHAMANVFPIDFIMRKKPVGHGYSACKVVKENPFFPVGLEFKGHEFHYSNPHINSLESIDFCYEVKRGKGVFSGKGGLVYKNVLGTYHHIHAIGLDCWASKMVQAAIRSIHT